MFSSVSSLASKAYGSANGDTRQEASSSVPSPSSTPRPQRAYNLGYTSTKGKTKDQGYDEENNGDLGLQGFSSYETIHAEGDTSSVGSSSPLSNRDRVGLNPNAKESSSSITSSQYFSATEEGTRKNAQAGHERSGINREEGEEGGKAPTKARRRRRSSKNHSKLRADLAGPPSERPAAGTSGGPQLSPRAASTAISSSSSSEKRISGGHGDLAAPSPHISPMPSMGMDGGSPLLPNSPVQPRPLPDVGPSFTEDTEESSSNLHMPGRRTSLAFDKPHDRTETGDHMLFPALGLGKSSSSSSEADNTTPRPSTTIHPLSSTASKIPPALKLDHTSSPALSDEAALQRWVLSIGCVNFDLEKGPDLEFLYPSLGISREEQDNIAFSSFPDTSIFDDGYSVFSWRVREVPLDSSASGAPHIGSSSAALDSTHTDKVKTSTKSDDSPKLKEVLLESPSSSSSDATGRTTSLADSIQGGRGGSSMRKSQSTSSGHHRMWGFGERTGWGSAGSEARETKSVTSSRSSSPLPKNMAAHDSARQNSVSANSSSSVEGHDDHRFARPPSALELKEKGNVPRLGQSPDHHTASLPTTTRRTSTSSNYIYGYCFFRQKRDASIRRGYFQKSIVILSHLPYVSLFSQIVAKLGPPFFEHGMPMIEAFCNDIRGWPSPEPGATLHLPMLGSVFSVSIPYGSQSQTSLSAESKLPPATSAAGKANSVFIRRGKHKSDGSSDEDPILASIPSNPMIDTFREAVSDLWRVWECMLLAEPILVVGPDPSTCSEAVWHLLDLIRPIPFAGDWRPFFTIHDYDFKTLVNRNKPASGTILGVTNPFMLQACQHWPHVLRVGKAAKRTGSASARYHSIGGSVGRKGGEPPRGGIAGGNSAGGGGPEHIPGFTSKRKRRVSKDRTLLRRLEEMAEKRTDDEAANAMLRRYFTDLTERFLSPLNRYVSSLIPATFDLSSPSETPKMKTFNVDDFLASLKAHGTTLPHKGKNLLNGSYVRHSIYLDFINCPNFSLWLHDRLCQAEEEQWRRRIAALEHGDVTSFARSKGEVETLDLYSRLVEEIRLVDLRLHVPPEPELGSRWRTNNVVEKPPASAPPSEVSGEGARVFRSTETTKSATANAKDEGNRTTPSTLAVPSSAKSLQNHFHGSANSEAGRTREQDLVARRQRLVAQADRVIGNLPEDLRGSLSLRGGQGMEDGEGS